MWAGSPTATGGRHPVACHSAIRAAVQTTGRGRLARGSSVPQAGFAVRCPARIAALSAARRVALIRVRVAAVTGWPAAALRRAMAVNIAWTWTVLRSASRMRPRQGSR